MERTFHTVMRQLGRWYDVEIKYMGEIKQRRFLGEVSRDLTLIKVAGYFAGFEYRFLK